MSGADDKEDAGPSGPDVKVRTVVESVTHATLGLVEVLREVIGQNVAQQTQIDDLKRMTVALTTVCTSLKQRLDARDKLDRELDDALREPPAPPML